MRFGQRCTLPLTKPTLRCRTAPPQRRQSFRIRVSRDPGGVNKIHPSTPGRIYLDMAHPRTTADPVTAVHQYLDAFNKGDVKAMAACFAVSGSILDGLAPHVWHGSTACGDWYRDVLVAAKHEGATDYLVVIGDALHANVTRDSAYVVAPATMTFKVHGRQITQSGAVFTVALRKHENGWRITAWAWAKGTPVAQGAPIGRQ